MRKLNPKLASVLLILGGLVALALILIFLFVPNFKEVARLSKEIMQARTELDAQYANRKKLLTSLSTATKGRVDIQTLSTQFVPAGREIDLITAIENLAAKNHVEEHFALSPADEAKAAVEQKENFTLTINGNFRAVMQMIVDLEKMPALLIVEGGAIHPGAGPTQDGTPPSESFLSVNLHGSIAEPPPGL